MDYALKENHPFHEKVTALMEFMDENGISIIAKTSEGFVLKDDNTGIMCFLKDHEMGSIETLPAICEIKLKLLD